MARVRRLNTLKTPDASRLPESLSQGAALLMEQEVSGLLDKVGKRVKIRRQGGYSGVDIWLFLLLYFTSGRLGSLKGFWRWLHPYTSRLAALGGRKSLASASSMSRALSSAENELVRESSNFILLEASSALPVLRHPAMLNLDACGQGWHVFDLDPTVTTLRQRELPKAQELPEARRLGAQSGAPGHSGRKRGELVFRRMTVQHAGSGVYVHAHLSKGNGNGVADLSPALDTIVTLCATLEHPLKKALVRMDGEFGNVPLMSACQTRGLGFITRLNRRSLYEAPEVLARLRTSSWHMVPDSLSGPQRGAADLGLLTLKPGVKTRRPDGGLYPPITVRLLATRFPKTGKAKRGRTFDGWQVELFATTLPGRNWPAAQSIAAYFARCGQENRFSQEDRELGLDHIFSYHLPGQELATLVGLSLWNRQIAKGLELEPIPETPRVPTLDTQNAMQTSTDERPHALWPTDPVLTRLLCSFEWDSLLAGHPNWRFDPDCGTLICDQKRILTLSSVDLESNSNGNTCLIFRRPTGGCEPCDSRPDCLRSVNTKAAKQLKVPVQPKSAEAIRHRLARLRGKIPDRLEFASLNYEPGPALAEESLFLPAEARKIFTSLFSDITLRVDFELPPSASPRPRLLALDHAHRQRRRCTWEQNHQRYALPDGAMVSVEIIGAREAALKLGLVEAGQTTSEACTAS